MKKYILLFTPNTLYTLITVLTFLTLLTLQTQQTFSQWYKQTVPVNKPITGIKFIDTLRGWACTDYGTQHDTGYVIHTSNGGINWYVQYKEAHGNFTTLNVIDNNNIYVAGWNDSGSYNYGGELIKSTNGGQTWTVYNLIINLYILNMQFLNIDSGWEAGGSVGPDVRTTTDGGLTWIVRTNGINNQTQKIFFLNYNTGFVTGNAGELWKTTNAGLNWIVNGNFQNSAVAIYFLNEMTGWIGGGNNNSNGTMWTTNGGLNWNPGQGSPGGYDVFFLNHMTGWAGVFSERIAITTDGGLNYNYQVDSGGSNHISFVDSLHGWTGSYTRIYHTSNKGGTIYYVGIINIGNKIPSQFKLFQNYPNPFNPSTNIRFSLVNQSFVQIKMYDVSGKEMTLWKSNPLSTGTHEIKFDGSGLASGVYFYQLIVTDLEGKEVFRETKKMILLK